MSKNKCNIGNSCGQACISQSKTCNIDFPTPVGNFLEEWASGNPPPGMAAYFTPDYRDMNRYLYDPSSRDELDPSISQKVEDLTNELAMIPASDESELQARYEAKGVHYDGKHFYRGMDFQDPEQFSRFLEEHPEGEIIEYAAFTSTTVANPYLEGGKLDGGWANKNLQIEIAHKTLDESKARHVDPYKKKKDEGEFLYPPGQRFRVRKVEVLQEQERLPSRFRDPLKQVFLSESDGFGIPNLPLRAILGDNEPSALMSNPEYEWFRSLLKKRGLPSAETWTPETTIGELYSKSKLKGGKVALYNNAEAALRKQVKPEEATGIMDPKNVRIVLEEV